MGPSFSSSIEQRLVILFRRVFPSDNELHRMSERGCVILFVILKFLRTSTYISREWSRFLIFELPNSCSTGADIVALGVVWGIAACGGPVVPYRGGRRTALGPGPLGVPEPTQDLATHTEKFRLQGFSPTEMISLVVCGHTIGSVRSADFPNLAQRNNSDPSGVGLSFFDSTRSYDSAM